MQRLAIQKADEWARIGALQAKLAQLKGGLAWLLCCSCWQLYFGQLMLDYRVSAAGLIRLTNMLTISCPTATLVCLACRKEAAEYRHQVSGG